MQLSGRKLAVVPAYNEVSTLGRVIAGLREHAPDFEILVIDDGSTDDTRRVAEASGARVLRHPFNLGIGGAVQSGFQFALEHGYDYMVQVDADGQHDPAEIDTLIEAMCADPSQDVICGSRFLKDLQYVGPISRREVAVKMYQRGGGASSIRSGKSIYYMIKVLLAIGVGLARARPVVEPGDEAPVTATAGI